MTGALAWQENEVCERRHGRHVTWGWQGAGSRTALLVAVVVAGGRRRVEKGGFTRRKI